MGLTDWINEKLEQLRAMILPDGDEGIRETRTSDKLELEFTSHSANVSAVRKSIEKFSLDAGLDQPAAEEIGLVVNEALANIIRHAYDNAEDKPIDVTALRKGKGVTISIRDWGKGVDPSPMVERERDLMTPGGLGLMCMQKLMDDVKYEPQTDGMLLTMTRTTPGSMIAGE
jgi:anti-sigma regulatory factor (Ser/Thr protein kinase)